VTCHRFRLARLLNARYLRSLGKPEQKRRQVAALQIFCYGARLEEASQSRSDRQTPRLKRRALQNLSVFPPNASNDPPKSLLLSRSANSCGVELLARNAALPQLGPRVEHVETQLQESDSLKQEMIVVWVWFFWLGQKRPRNHTNKIGSGSCVFRGLFFLLSENPSASARPASPGKLSPAGGVTAQFNSMVVLVWLARAPTQAEGVSQVQLQIEFLDSHSRRRNYRRASAEIVQNALFPICCLNKLV